jgi:hypothetical protein
MPPESSGPRSKRQKTGLANFPQSRAPRRCDRVQPQVICHRLTLIPSSTFVSAKSPICRSWHQPAQQCRTRRTGSNLTSSRPVEAVCQLSHSTSEFGASQVTSSRFQVGPPCPEPPKAKSPSHQNSPLPHTFDTSLLCTDKKTCNLYNLCNPCNCRKVSIVSNSVFIPSTLSRRSMQIADSGV